MSFHGDVDSSRSLKGVENKTVVAFFFSGMVFSFVLSNKPRMVYYKVDRVSDIICQGKIQFRIRFCILEIVSSIHLP